MTPYYGDFVTIVFWYLGNGPHCFQSEWWL